MVVDSSAESELILMDISRNSIVLRVCPRYAEAAETLGPCG